MDKTFTRRIENFTCGHCGHAMTGDGYTNHCAQCLWSRHVDINPGDRAAQCGGLMAPKGLEIRQGTYVITHQCTQCAHTRKNKTAPQDDMARIIALSSGPFP